MVSIVSMSIVVSTYIAVDNFSKRVRSDIENEFEVITTNLMDKLSGGKCLKDLRTYFSFN